MNCTLHGDIHCSETGWVANCTTQHNNTILYIDFPAPLEVSSQQYNTISSQRPVPFQRSNPAAAASCRQEAGTWAGVGLASCSPRKSSNKNTRSPPRLRTSMHPSTHVDSHIHRLVVCPILQVLETGSLVVLSPPARTPASPAAWRRCQGLAACQTAAPVTFDK